jgi:hypothetical protein
MEVSGVSPTATGNMASVNVQQGVAAFAMKKMLDIETAQSEALLRLVNTTSGLGQSMDINA